MNIIRHDDAQLPSLATATAAPILVVDQNASSTIDRKICRGRSAPFLQSLALFLCVQALAAVFPVATAAETAFIQTSRGVLQSPDERLKVLIAETVPGIFVYYGEPIGLQEFDPSQIQVGDQEAGGVVHFFLEYSPNLDRYTNLHVAGAVFAIRGGFTLHIAGMSHSLRLAVDNNNPYASLAYESSLPASQKPDLRFNKSEPLILGFQGNSLLVNKSGDRYVALLGANEFNEQLQGLIEPYVLKDGTLLLKGKHLSTPRIGLEIEPSKNVCLGRGARLLSRREISTLLKTGDRRTHLQQLEKLLAQPLSERDPFEGQLLLNITPQSIVALDPTQELVRVVRPIGKGEQVICRVEEIQLSE